MKSYDPTQRLDKFLANSGYASRRSIKQFLREQTVTLNRERVRESGTRIDLTRDEIRINGQKIKQTSFVYYLLNKPKGILSTSSDEYGRQNVTDLVPSGHRVYPVGRLDKDTHGLILLTNDGELTHKLTHPKFHVPKKYLLEVKGEVPEEKIEKLRRGIILSDGLTAPARVKLIKQAKPTIIEIEIFEGRYRQIRRMCDALRIDLLDLERIAFGPIKTGGLREGKYRELDEKEINELKQASSQSAQDHLQLGQS